MRIESKNAENPLEVSVHSSALSLAFDIVKKNLAQYKTSKPSPEQLNSLLYVCDDLVDVVKIKMLILNEGEKKLLLKDLNEFLVEFKKHYAPVSSTPKVYLDLNPDMLVWYENLIFCFEPFIKKLTNNEFSSIENDDIFLLFDELINILKNQDQIKTAKADCILLCQQFSTQLMAQKNISDLEKHIVFRTIQIAFDFQMSLRSTPIENPSLLQVLEISKKNILALQESYKENALENKSEIQAPKKDQIKLFFHHLMSEELCKFMIGDISLSDMCITTNGLFASFIHRAHVQTHRQSGVKQLFIYDIKNKASVVRDFKFLKPRFVAHADKLLIEDSGKMVSCDLKDDIVADMPKITGVDTSCQQVLCINISNCSWDRIVRYRDRFALLNTTNNNFKVIKPEFKMGSKSTMLLRDQNLLFYNLDNFAAVNKVSVYSFDFSQESFVELISFQGSCHEMRSISNDRVAFLVPEYFPSNEGYEPPPQWQLVIWDITNKQKINELTISQSVLVEVGFHDKIFLVDLPQDLFAIIYAEKMPDKNSRVLIEVYNQNGIIISKEIIPQSFGILGNVQPIYNPESGCILLQNNQSEIFEYNYKYPLEVEAMLSTCLPQVSNPLLQIICDYSFFPTKRLSERLDYLADSKAENSKPVNLLPQTK